ncbi:jupiter microtubule associated homolog 1 isoform X2 [Microcaecilia unicolor]|uniref:Jupiter microtubule associated homolog 1 isoform X2 n=1 Tax=Microcaecilia unicolor TaxID=1415580 RepID=A0A6P7YM84_9AMPH|nr:jupiter microtubule associated homolog 1 isoform X2 [Microcaecilia unicolor]
MTTTTTFQGMNPEGKSSSRVLRPPGGGSSFTLGTGETPQQSVRKNRMASNIFGPPEDSLSTASHTNIPGDKTTSVHEELNQSSPRRSSSGGNCGDSADKGDANDLENNELDKSAQGQSEDLPSTLVPPTEPTPVLPVTVPSRRNPPGGKSSLVLG